MAVDGWHIVFLHGLESGPNGQKARFLRRSFGADNVSVPDLHMSSTAVSKRNSFVRCFLSIRTSLEGCLDDAMKVLTPWVEREETKSAQMGEVGRKRLLLIGSSWGGLVALKAVENRRVRPDKMLLLAPALKLVSLVRHVWPAEFTTCKELVQRTDEGQTGKRPETPFVTVVHGTADTTCEIEGSRALQGSFPDLVRLLEIEGARHALNELLDVQEPQSLKWLVDQLLTGSEVGEMQLAVPDKAVTM